MYLSDVLFRRAVSPERNPRRSEIVACVFLVGSVYDLVLKPVE